MFRQTYVRINRVPKWFLLNCKASCSSVPLKENLLKNLKDIRGCNRAHILCGELIYAKNTFENLMTVPSDSWFDYKRDARSIIQLMQGILDNDKPEYALVDMIWMVLHGKTNNPSNDELMSLLNNISKFPVPYFFDKIKSKECLNQIVKDMEYLISSCDKHSLYFSYRQKYPPGGLDLLQFVLLKVALNRADDLLHTVFQVCEAHVMFSEEEKKKVGTLMTGAIIPIHNTVLDMADVYNLRRSWLQKRSSLQFCKDVFAKFPTVYGTTLENFYMEKIERSIQRLDDLITDWCEYTSECIDDNQWEPMHSSESDDTDLDVAYASKMPKSHTWWGKCSSLLSKLKSLKMSRDRSNSEKLTNFEESSIFKRQIPTFRKQHTYFDR